MLGISLLAGLVLLTLLLGFWQFGRMQQKEQLLAYQARQRTLPVQVWDGQGRPEAGRRVTLLGTPLTAQRFYLDQRTDNGRVGVVEVMPWRLQRGQVVLVETGWVDSATHAPLPASPWVLMAPWPRYLELGPTPPVGRVFQNVDPVKFAHWASLPIPVAYAVSPLRQAALQTTAVTPSRHLGYALTWWCMSVIGFFLCLKFYRQSKGKA